MPISESSPRHLLTVAEAAELLNVSTSTVRRRIWDGEIPAVRLGSGPQPPVRIAANQLEEFLNRGLSKPPVAEAVGNAERRPSHGGAEEEA